MPTYDYKCADCSHPFEVVKSMSQLDEMESCPSCLASCDKRCRLITKGKEFFGEKPDEPYFSSALGKWVKGKKDESKQAKERGWIEVGNQSVEKNVGALHSHSMLTNDSNVYVVMSGNFTPAQRQIVKS